MKYQRRSFTVAVQTNFEHPLAADLESIFQQETEEQVTENEPEDTEEDTSSEDTSE